MNTYPTRLILTQHLMTKHLMTKPSVLLSLFILTTACASGQAELVSLAQTSQDEARACREQLTEERVSARLASEKSQSCFTSLKKVKSRAAEQRASLLEQLELTLQAEASKRTKLSPTADSSDTKHNPNLRALQPKQIIHFVNQVGGKAKRVGRHLMAVFGNIKAQIIYSPKDHVLTTHARFKGYQGDLKFINDWNRTKRFSRAYLDKDGDIVLEAEVDLEPGMSSEAIKSWLRGFGLVLNFFQHSLVKQKGQQEPTKENGNPQSHRI